MTIVGGPALDRRPRRGEVVLARAAGAGVVGGALLGALVLLPDLVVYWEAHDPSVAPTVDPQSLLIAALVGALVGLLAAVAAAVGWLLAVKGSRDRPRLSRGIAALSAAATVMMSAVAFGVADTPLGIGGSLVAGGLAAAFAPALGYRPRP